jgi:hypothetical protein
MSVVLSNHYSDSHHYELWPYNDTTYLNWILKLVILNTKGVSRLADIGGGNGDFSKILIEATGMKVVCVDKYCSGNSTDYLKFIKKDALDYVEELPPMSYDCFLLKEFIHHISPSNYVEFFSGIKNKLFTRGSVLIITRPKHQINYPFCQKAKDTWAHNQPDESVIVSGLYKAGFDNVVSVVHQIPISLSLSIWEKSLRNRMWSIFEEFTDSEIENTIDVGRSVALDSTIQFYEKLIFIKAAIK